MYMKSTEIHKIYAKYSEENYYYFVMNTAKKIIMLFLLKYLFYNMYLTF